MRRDTRHKTDEDMLRRDTRHKTGEDILRRDTRHKTDEDILRRDSRHDDDLLRRDARLAITEIKRRSEEGDEWIGRRRLTGQTDVEGL